MNIDKTKPIFFCGVGGSGMMPLALILRSKGYTVYGSDRDNDKNPNGSKFELLNDCGVKIFPQDGSGMDEQVGCLVVSSAIEDSIPDVAKAKSCEVLIRKRADILSELFHASDCSIGVVGTSGKTTVTGMIATILDGLNLNPTVVNGGRVKNLEENSKNMFGSLLVGSNDYFVSEVDESDGSIDLFSADIAVLNNIALDHTSIEKLIEYFQSFIDRSNKSCILNMDNNFVSELKITKPTITYGIDYKLDVDLRASDLKPTSYGVDFMVNDLPVKLKVPGKHNVSNALAALSVAKFLDIDLEKAIKSLETFSGIKRRLETIGTTKTNITVIDDFGHNPDKISASLSALKEFDGRLIVMFQPHGFAPLRTMGKEMAQSFGDNLSANDIVCIPEVYYAGGTVDRSVTSKDFVEMIKNNGCSASWFESRDTVETFIKSEMRDGDRIVIMGARDDSLTLFAKSFL